MGNTRKKQPCKGICREEIPLKILKLKFEFQF